MKRNYCQTICNVKAKIYHKEVSKFISLYNSKFCRYWYSAHISTPWKHFNVCFYLITFVYIHYLVMIPRQGLVKWYQGRYCVWLLSHNSKKGFVYNDYLVMIPRKGLMRRGASVCPKKMLAAAFSDSAAVVPTVMLNSQPIFITTHWNR